MDLERKGGNLKKKRKKLNGVYEVGERGEKKKTVKKMDIWIIKERKEKAGKRSKWREREGGNRKKLKKETRMQMKQDKRNKEKMRNMPRKERHENTNERKQE